MSFVWEWIKDKWVKKKKILLNTLHGCLFGSILFPCWTYKRYRHKLVTKFKQQTNMDEGFCLKMSFLEGKVALFSIFDVDCLK